MEQVTLGRISEVEVGAGIARGQYVVHQESSTTGQGTIYTPDHCTGDGGHFCLVPSHDEMIGCQLDLVTRLSRDD